MIREKLSMYETLSPDIKPFEKIFLGGIAGVVLRKRGKNDSYVCFSIITEDDGHWFPCTNNGSSSFWFDDYINVLQYAMRWCKNNCVPHIIRGIQYGWSFKKESTDITLEKNEKNI